MLYLPSKKSNARFTIISVLLCIIMCFNNAVYAQIPGNLSKVRVEELTDDQISRFILEANRLGIKDNEIEMQALQNGMNPDEIVKLRSRLLAVRKSINNANSKFLQPDAKSSKGVLRDSITAIEKSAIPDYMSVF